MSPAQEMKARIRGDLTNALKAKRVDKIAVLRSLLAAIDNAEAPPISSGPASVSRTSEVERLILTGDELQEVLRRDIEEREQAAGELAGVGQRERADALVRQAAIVRLYLG